jgi:hypothetical protein
MVANWNHTIESMSPSQQEALLKLLYKKNTKDLETDLSAEH